MTNKRLNRLAVEISAWSERNFPIRESRLGIIEEIGEAAHCLLKRKQGIRGFDNEEYFKEQLADALADTAIYALDYLGQSGDFIQYDYEDPKAFKPDRSTEEFIAGLSRFGADLIEAADDYEYRAHDVYNIMVCLYAVGAHNGIDFYAKLEETWAKVSKRDWVKNPTNANVIAESL